MRLLVILAFVFPAQIALAEEYPYTNAWSSGQQREEWTQQLREMSISEPRVRFHLIGQLHGLSAAIPLADPSANGVLEVLESIRPMLGIKDEEILRATRTDRTTALVPVGADIVEVERVEVGVEVRFGDFAESGRAIVVQVEPSEGLILGIFNAHIPSLDGYASFGGIVSVDDALLEIKAAEGGACELVRSELGWVALDWMNNSTPGTKSLVWSLKVRTPEDGLRDYAVDADTGSIVFQGQNRFPFAHQKHVSYVLNGGIYFSTVPGGPVCNALSATCTDPAFTDSLASRASMPGITAEYETLTSGNTGISGWWRTPVSWAGKPRLNPWQNNHRDPATDSFRFPAATTAGGSPMATAT